MNDRKLISIDIDGVMSDYFSKSKEQEILAKQAKRESKIDKILSEDDREEDTETNS
jgi:hypothetical protein